MSFVKISRREHKNKDGKENVLSPEAEAQEQEIRNRVQQALDQLRQKVMEEAAEAAAIEARASLQTVESQLRQALSALESACSQLSAPLAQREQDVAELVLDMAFQLACHVVGEHVTRDQAPLRSLVTKLLREASAEQTAQQRLILRLNPADISGLKDIPAGPDIDLVADASLSPGGAVVELIAKEGDQLDKAEWDARLESRLEALRKALLLPEKAVE